MANASISTGNKTTRFQKEVAREYVRGGKFERYIGNDSDWEQHNIEEQGEVTEFSDTEQGESQQADWFTEG